MTAAAAAAAVRRRLVGRYLLSRQPSTPTPSLSAKKIEVICACPRPTSAVSKLLSPYHVHTIGRSSMLPLGKYGGWGAMMRPGRKLSSSAGSEKEEGKEEEGKVKEEKGKEDEEKSSSAGSEKEEPSSAGSEQGKGNQEEEGKRKPTRPPPVTQLRFLNQMEVNEEEWIDFSEYMKNISLACDGENSALMEKQIGEGSDFSKLAKPIIHQLILIAFSNSNRGYCSKDAFVLENIRARPRLNCVALKSTEMFCELGEMGSCTDRSSSYRSVGRLVNDMVEAQGAKLGAGPKDLLAKLEKPGFESLILFHPSLMTYLGISYLYHRLYDLLCSKYKHPGEDTYLSSSSGPFPKDAKDRILMAVFYQDECISVFKKHSLLSSILGSSYDLTLENSARGRASKYNNFKFVAQVRHSSAHWHDPTVLQNHRIKKMLPFTYEQFVLMINSKEPMYLVHALESFIACDQFQQLEITFCWHMDFSALGEVPKPDLSDETSPASQDLKRIIKRFPSLAPEEVKNERPPLKLPPQYEMAMPLMSKRPSLDWGFDEFFGKK